MRLSVLVNGRSHCLGPLGYPPPLSLIFAEESPTLGTHMHGLTRSLPFLQFSLESTLLIWELSHHGFPRLSTMASHFRGPPRLLPTLHPGNSLMEECWADFLFLASQGSLTLFPELQYPEIIVAYIASIFWLFQAGGYSHSYYSILANS